MDNKEWDQINYPILQLQQLQRWNRSSLEGGYVSLSVFYTAYDYLSMLGLKLTHVITSSLVRFSWYTPCPVDYQPGSWIWKISPFITTYDFYNRSLLDSDVRIHETAYLFVIHETGHIDGSTPPATAVTGCQ